MKDQLGEAPPTIGDLRRQGVAAFRVRCQRPCKRIGRAGGRTGVSSPLWSRQHAAQSVRRHIGEGSKVVRVETPTGVIEADGIAEWLASAERS